MMFYDYYADVPEDTLRDFVTAQELGRLITVDGKGQPHIGLYPFRLTGDAIEMHLHRNDEQLADLADLGAVRAWLIRIATRQAFDLLRARRPAVDLATQEPPEPDDHGPARLVENGTQIEALRVALGALPEAQRQCWILREVAGYSYEDIAETMSCPIGTVRSRIFRAREAIDEKLRPLLSDREDQT